jgi:hypothetical protein
MITYRTIHKQLKKELARNMAEAKADVEKTEKDLADAKNVITSKDSEVSTVHLCVYVCICVFFFVRVCVCVCVRERERERE